MCCAVFNFDIKRLEPFRQKSFIVLALFRGATSCTRQKRTRTSSSSKNNDFYVENKERNDNNNNNNNNSNTPAGMAVHRRVNHRVLIFI